MILPSASPVSWLLALAAALAYAAPAAAASRLGAAASRNALLAAWVLHGALLVWGLWGEAPRFGFAPALSMTAWLVLTVYAVERQLFPQMRARWMLAALGAATIVLALLFPGQPLHVKASAWLPLHLALGIACYGLFAAAVVHAWLMTRAERHIRQAEDPDSGIPLLTLERLTFRFVTAGFVLLSATLLAGWLFSDMLYGRAWRWTTRRFSRSCRGWCLPRCCWGGHASAGGGAMRCASSMQAPHCSCWRMSAHASCLK